MNGPSKSTPWSFPGVVRDPARSIEVVSSNARHDASGWMAKVVSSPIGTYADVSAGRLEWPRLHYEGAIAVIISDS